jgi:hypothetical protein
MKKNLDRYMHAYIHRWGNHKGKVALSPSFNRVGKETTRREGGDRAPWSINIAWSL